MSQELNRIKVFNDNGTISYSYETVADMVKKIASYIEPMDVIASKIKFIEEFSQLVFMITIKTNSKSFPYKLNQVSNYKSELKEQIQSCLNIRGFIIWLTFVE